MKKGCFLKSVIVLTIIVASIAYLIQFKSKGLFFEPGKKMLASWFADDFKKNIDFVIQSPQKDSLNLLIKSFIESAEDFKDLSEDPLQDFLRTVDGIISDSVITSNELDNLRNKIHKRITQ